MSVDLKDKGLMQKYNVSRVDGKLMSDCVVLEFKDPIARAGIKAWCDEMDKNGFSMAAHDARRMLAEYETLDVSCPVLELRKADEKLIVDTPPDEIA